jgi:GTP-binding protein HflX
VFLADVVPPQSDAEVAHQRMAELENLVSTYHGLVVVKCIQKKYRPDYKSYIGTGKLQEIKQEMKQLNATVLIMGNILKP